MLYVPLPQTSLKQVSKCHRESQEKKEKRKEEIQTLGNKEYTATGHFMKRKWRKNKKKVNGQERNLGENKLNKRLSRNGLFSKTVINTQAGKGVCV